MEIKKLYPGGKEKAFTLSYDDGVRQDIALISTINRYHIKATFNLNSGRLESIGSWTTVPTNRISRTVAKTLYFGHEIAVHTVNHPSLAKLSPDEIYGEVKEDMESLSELALYPVRGMAYPNGSYDDKVIEVLKKCGIAYSRTVVSTHGFDLPENPLALHPTCHHNEKAVFRLLDDFQNTDKELALCYIWGHSYEFDTNNNWDVLENICQKASEIRSCWFATNIEIIDYINAMKDLEMSDDKVKNNSSAALWLNIDKKIVRLDPGEEYIEE